MRVFRNPGHTISSFLAPIPQKPNNTDWRRNEICQLNFKRPWIEPSTTLKTRSVFWILIVSKGSEIEHGNLVETVFKKLDAENLALKLSKCKFFKQEVNWLGHHLSEAEVRPKITKTEAVVNLNPPKLRKQLRSFLGSINHLDKFIPNAASLTEKLRPLLKEENQKKKLKNMKLPVTKSEWGMNTR